MLSTNATLSFTVLQTWSTLASLLVLVVCGIYLAHHLCAWLGATTVVEDPATTIPEATPAYRAPQPRFFDEREEVPFDQETAVARFA